MVQGIRCPLRKAGSRFKNVDGDWITIGKDADIRRVHGVFDSGTVGVFHYSHIKGGDFKDWMKPVLYGVGYAGSPRIRGDGFDKAIYGRWAAMLQRCYTPILRKDQKQRTYEGAVVCDEWHNYTNFAAWFTSKKHCEKTSWHLDKDLLCGGRGKIYSPAVCVLLPQEINTCIQTVSHRDANCKSIGVFFEESTGLFVASMRRSGNHSTRIGKFKTEEEAAAAYKGEKERFVKCLAEKWKDEIEVKTHEALLKWEVPVINFEENDIV